MGAQVVGIAVDAPAALKAFSDQNKLAFPLLTDYTREVSKKYPGIYESFGNIPGLTAAKRAVFVLDGQGIVKYAWITENPGTEPDYNEVKKALASF
jgi:peroxiredoxin